MRKKMFSKDREMAVRNTAFDLVKEERTQASFYKFVQGADLCSEKIRELPQDLISEFTSFTMVLKVIWGMSWEVELLKNPRFCYMEKRGWEKFVSDNALGKSEFLTFTHEGDMSFRINIFEQNGAEMIRPRLSLASSSRIKTEQERDVSNYLGKRSAEPTRGAKDKREFNLGKKKVVQIDSAGPSSSSAPQFTIVIKNSHNRVITIPAAFAKKNKFSKEKRLFKINHPNGEMSWMVECVPKNTETQCVTLLSSGWTNLFRQYPIDIGDSCEFILTKPTEMVLVVSKAGKKTP